MKTAEEIITLIGEESAEKIFVFFGGKYKYFSRKYKKPAGLFIEDTAWNRLIAHYGDNQVYIPKPKKNRNNIIIDMRKNGYEISFISDTFNLSYRHVVSIIKNSRC